MTNGVLAVAAALHGGSECKQLSQVSCNDEK